MRLKRTYIIPFLLISFILVFTSCKKKKEADAIPLIESAEYEFVRNDSLVIKFHFIDGDGDIGLFPEQIGEPPFNVDPLPGDPLFIFTFRDPSTNIWVTDSFNLNSYQVTMEYFAMENGSWFRPDIKPRSVFGLDDLTPDGQDKYLEGDISVGIKLFDTEDAWPRDTMMFEITLVDRQLNRSNAMETPIILKPL
ncbi:MAG: hypothetical protein ACI8XB_000998 [Patiriisocius sp.]|jgi:hypothetical protein